MKFIFRLLWAVVLSLSALSMEWGSSRKIRAIDEHLADISAKKERWELELKKQARAIMVSAHTVSGDDIIAFGKHEFFLVAKKPYFIPSHRWFSCNCDISIVEEREDGVLVSVSPHLFPCLGQAPVLTGATWKAIVWLEHIAYSDRETDHPSEKMILEKISELDLCARQLIIEKRRHERENAVLLEKHDLYHLQKNCGSPSQNHL